MSQIIKPKVGYKRVKGILGKFDEVPKNWQKITIKQLGIIKSGGTPSTEIKEYWENGTIPWINSGEINNGPVLKHSKMITQKGLNESSAKMFPKNTVVIALTGATTGKVGILTFDSTTNQSVTGIYPSKKFASMFLFYLLTSLRNQLLRYSVGSAQPHINQKIIESFLISFPPIEEQQKITSILSNIDNLIQNTEKIIQQTTRLKKALMQQLLTRGIDRTKFKKVKWLFGNEIEIPEEWEIKKFKKISQINPTSIDQNYPHNKINYVDISSIENFQIQNFEQFLTSERPSRAQRIIQKGDILVSTVRPYLQAFSIVEDIELNLICSTGFTVLRSNNSKLTIFLFNFIKSNIFKNYVIRLMEGVTYPAITSKMVENCLIPIPPIEEQQKIASILSNTDSQIYTQIQYKEKLETIKKGLMQQLLTGKIRVSLS